VNEPSRRPARAGCRGRLAPGRQGVAEMHGQFKFNFRHPAISPDASNELRDGRIRWISSATARAST